MNATRIKLRVIFTIFITILLIFSAKVYVNIMSIKPTWYALFITLYILVTIVQVFLFNEDIEAVVEKNHLNPWLKGSIPTTIISILPAIILIMIIIIIDIVQGWRLGCNPITLLFYVIASNFLLYGAFNRRIVTFRFLSANGNTPQVNAAVAIQRPRLNALDFSDANRPADLRLGLPLPGRGRVLEQDFADATRPADED